MDSAERSVVLRYCGHSSFLWRTPSGTRILIDPYRNPDETEGRWFVREFPAVRADMVLVSHPHYDHAAVERVLGRPTVIRTPGTFSGTGFTITGLIGRHAGESGQSFGQVNLIFTITIAGITYCHLGDNRAEIPQSVHSKLSKVDVLMISVDDSQHLLAFREVDSLIRLLNPRMVIPMHYLYPGLTDPRSTLLGLDGWLATQRTVVRIKSDSMEIHPRLLPTKTEIWVFEEVYRHDSKDP